MESVKIWNRIVKHYKDNYTAKEDVLQKDWEQIFSDLLNYSRFFGEIDSHRNIHIGSYKRTIPDIIIRGESGDLFDVELKQYNHAFTMDMEDQLKSYLDLLHISVGILICQSAYLYVYDFSKSKLKRIEISFIEDNPDGIMLVELIKKGNFAPEKVEAYIDSKMTFDANVEFIKSQINKNLVNALLIEHFSKSYTKDEIIKAIGDDDYSGVTAVVSESATVELPKQPKEIETDNSETETIYQEPSFDYVMIKTSNERIQMCNGSLYEATRFAWRAGKRIEGYKYVLSVTDMIVREVYKADSWNIVKQGELEGRYEFHGEIANEEEARKLVGKKIPFKYRKPGAANPIMFKKKD